MQVSPCSSARLWGEPGQVACRLLIDDRYKRWPVLPNAGHTARSDTAAWYCAQQHAVLAERVQVQPVETSGGRHGHATPVHRQTLQQPDQTVIVSSGFGFPEPPLTVFMQSTCKLDPASTQAVSPVCCSARLLLALLIQTRSPLVQTLPPSSHHSHPPSGQAPGARCLASAQRKRPSGAAEHCCNKHRRGLAGAPAGHAPCGTRRAAAHARPQPAARRARCTAAPAGRPGRCS